MNALKTINFIEAKQLAKEIIKLAEEELSDIAVTVINITGKRLVSLAMDGAIGIASELSEKKARLALQMGLNTIELQKEGINVMDFGSGYSSFGGGAVIRLEAEIIGAIGVSGLNTGQLDHDLAIKVLEKMKWE